MQYAVAQGAALDASVSEAACRNGHLQCLVFAIEHQCTLSEQCVIAAVRHGHVICVQALVAHNLQANPAVCAAAAANGQLECLTYLHKELSCGLDEPLLLAAAAQGHLACLKYIHAHLPDITLSVSMTAAAAQAPTCECLQYLRAAGCPWDHTAAIQAATRGSCDCLKYIHKHGGMITSEAQEAAVDIYTLLWFVRMESDCLHAEIARMKHYFVGNK